MLPYCNPSKVCTTEGRFPAEGAAVSPEIDGEISEKQDVDDRNKSRATSSRPGCPTMTRRVLPHAYALSSSRVSSTASRISAPVGNGRTRKPPRQWRARGRASNRQISAPAARSAGRKSYVSQKVQFPSAARSGCLTRPSTWASTKTPHVLQTGHCHIQPTSGRLRNRLLRSLPNGVSYSRGTYISLHRAVVG